jgi:methyl-accepting chemotaxis protein
MTAAGTTVQTSHSITQHSDSITQHSDSITQHSDSITQHSDSIAQHSDIITLCKTYHTAQNSITQHVALFMEHHTAGFS